MTIRARYSGLCPECGGRWETGDIICGADNGLPYEQRRRPTVWRHVSCPDAPSDYEHHAPVCDRCWLSHAGECDR